MYGINTHWHFRDPLTDSLRQALEQNLVKPAVASPGFQAYYALRPTDREVVSFQVWETRAHAEGFLQQVGPWVQQHVAPLLTNPPERTAGEIAVVREK